MCEPATIGAVVMAVATVAQGYQAKQQGKYEKGVSEYNAAQMKNEATQTRNKAVEEENIHRDKVIQMMSKQRAQLASQGVNLGTGSALQLQEDTLSLGEADALRIRRNYTQQAESMEQSAALTLDQGKAAEKAGRTAFKISILKAAGQSLSGVNSKWLTPSSAATNPGVSAVGGGGSFGSSTFNQSLWDTRLAGVK